MRWCLSALLIFSASLPSQAAPLPFATSAGNFSCRDIITGKPIPNAVVSIRMPGMAQWFSLPPTDVDGFVAARYPIVFVNGTSFEASALDLRGRVAQRTFWIGDVKLCCPTGVRTYSFTLYLHAPGGAVVDPTEPCGGDHEERLVFVRRTDLPCTEGSYIDDMYYVAGSPAGKKHVTRKGDNAITTEVNVGTDLTLATDAGLVHGNLTLTSKLGGSTRYSSSIEVDTELGGDYKLPGKCGRLILRVQLERMTFEHQERWCKAKSSMNCCTRWSEWLTSGSKDVDVPKGTCYDDTELKDCDVKGGEEVMLATDLTTGEWLEVLAPEERRHDPDFSAAVQAADPIGELLGKLRAERERATRIMRLWLVALAVLVLGDVALFALTR